MVDIARELGAAEVRRVAIPADCTDGFFGAFWRRPDAYLDPAVRAGISTFNELGPAIVDRALTALRYDLAQGRWQEQHGDLLKLSELDLGYRLVVAGRSGHANP